MLRLQVLSIIFFSSLVIACNIPSKDEKKLFKSVIDCNIAELKRMIDKDVSVNIFDEKGLAPMHYAAKNCGVDILQILLDAGADINVRTRKPCVDSPSCHIPSKDERELLKSVIDCNITELRRLIDKDVSVNIFDGMGWAPMHYAAKSCGVDILQMLLDAGADINVRTRRPCFVSCHIPNKDERELFKSVKDCNIAELKRMIDKDASVNIFDEMGWAPMHYAVTNCGGPLVWSTGIDILRLLLDAGADINVRTREPCVASCNILSKDEKKLFKSVIGCNRADLKRIIDKNVSLNIFDEMGWSPMHYAVKNCDVNILEMLLDGGGDINIRTQKPCLVV